MTFVSAVCREKLVHSARSGSLVVHWLEVGQGTWIGYENERAAAHARECDVRDAEIFAGKAKTEYTP
jgi:hypothetical protein